MSQRQGAKTQGLSLKVAWQGIAWKKGQRHVFRLQKRIYRAAQREDVRTVHKLQKLLVKSWYARLLAVRRITQDNRGKHTAGIDGAKTLTPPQRWRLANTLHLDGTATTRWCRIVSERATRHRHGSAQAVDRTAASASARVARCGGRVAGECHS